MALVRRDESANRKLNTHSPYNVSITLSVTLDAYTEEERIASSQAHQRGRKNGESDTSVLGDASEASSIDLQAHGLSEFYSD
jgi:hypothetical protein